MYNYSARRKQGLGSLRPGYFFGGPIGNQLLSNAMQWGINKGVDYFTKSPEQRKEEKYRRTMEMLGIRPYFGPNEKNDDEESTTTYGKSGIGGGILNALATMILGPIMGPIAMTVGTGLMNKSKGLGFFGGDGPGPGPGPKGKNTDWYKGSDEEDKDNEWDPTKPTGAPSHIGPTGHDIHGDTHSDTTTTTTTSAPSHIGPTGHDIHGGGSDGVSNGVETRDSSGWESSPFFKGGRVSYSKGGLASLWQR